MANRDDIFPSKYLRASDLNDTAIVGTIQSATTETLKSPDGTQQTKTILSFKGGKKTLPLNMTNWDAVAIITGEGDTDKWPGHKIELYPTTTEMKGKTVDCIRIRAPAQGELPKAKAENKRPAKSAKEADDDDMDDEIPF
jgi:hypothetical protein